MTTFTVTYSAAKAAGACPEGRRWAKNWIATHEGADTDTPIPLADVLDARFEWVVWCLPIVQPEADMLRIARLWACDCAERVLPLTGGDERNRAAIDVARRYAVGEATDEELAAARAAAMDAAWAAARAAARDAAMDAAWAAARAAARDAAWAAAWTAARDAAWTAAWTAARDAAWTAARDTAWDAAWDAEEKWQSDRLRLYLIGAELPPIEPITLRDKVAVKAVQS